MANARERRIDPHRPALSLIFVYSMAFWASCAASYSFARVASDSCTLGFAISGIALALSGLGSIRSSIRHPLLIAAALSAGLMLGFAQGYALHRTCASIGEETSSDVVVSLVQDSSNKGNGEQALGEVELASGPPLLATVRFPDDEPRLYGETYRCTMRFVAANYSEEQYPWSVGSCGTAWVSDVERMEHESPFGFLISARSKAIERIGAQDDAHCIIQALACGYRHGISDTPTYQAYQSCGLAHLVAVSGAHLVIVTSLLASLLQTMCVPRKASIFILVTLMVGYLVLSGCPVSALRATAMSSIGVFSLIAKRRPSSINALGIGVFAIIAAHPANSVSVSFALSTLSTLGIVCLAPLVQSWLDRGIMRRVPFITDALSLTISSSALSQLYASSIFMTLPLVSPLANIFAAPLFPAVCSLGLASGVMEVLNLPGADVALLLATWCAEVLDALVVLLACIPYSSIPFWIPTIAALALSASAAFLLWAIWPSAKQALEFACIAALFPIAFALIPPDHDELVMFDVGQGDSILVRSNGQSVLIDTGNQDRLLEQELARNNVVHLDAVLITHADDDHCGSLSVLRDCVQVDRIMLAKGMGGSSSEKAAKLVSAAQEVSSALVEVSAGDRFRVGDFSATVVWPVEMKDDGGNADSICLRLSYDGDSDGFEDYSAFLTGDAEKEQLQSMIDEDAIESVDVLKVGHHGSRNAMYEEQLRVLNPQVALIGVGKNNRYGHPTDEILSMLDDISCRTYRTDLDSQITCAFSASSLTVNTLSDDWTLSLSS